MCISLQICSVSPYIDVAIVLLFLSRDIITVVLLLLLLVLLCIKKY